MHSEQVAPMGAEVGGFSGDAKKEKDSNRSSDNDAILLSSPVNNASCGSPNTSKETSHLLGACSSHGSFSENEESGETLRDFNASADIQMIIKPTISQADENCGSLKTPIFHDNRVSSQPEKHRELECIGGGNPCISGSDYMKMRVDDHKGDAYGKNVSCCCSTANSFSQVQKVVHDQPSSSCLSGTPFGNTDTRNLKRLKIFTKDSLQEIFCCSKLSDLSEISSIRDSCAGTSSLKGERSECSEEQVQSSFTRETTLRISSLMADEHSTTGSLHVGTGNKRQQSAEAATCPNNFEHFRMSPTAVKEAGKRGTIVGSVPADCGDGFGILEYDVKVCDICGDVGKEESLAICSKCSDGAEHIYCMRVKLDKVPKGDWMCEECALSEETEKQQQKKIEKEVRPLKNLSSNERRQNSQNSKAFHFRDTLQSHVRGSAFEKIRTYKVISSRPSSAKSPTGSVEAISVRKRPFGTIAKFPNRLSHSKKTLRGQPSGTDMKTAQIRSTSAGKSLTMPLQSQMSKGFLSKSKSFPTTSLKEKVQPSREGSGLMQDFARETVKNDSKEGVAKTMLKSLSFNNAMSNGQKNTSHDFKKFPLQFSSGGSLKRLRHVKKQSLTKTKKTLSSAVHNPAALKVVEKITAHAKTSLPEFPRSNYKDLPGDKSHLRSSSSLEPSGQLTKRGFLTQDKKGSVNGVRLPVEDSVEVVSANNANHSNAAVHSEERACQRDTSLFASLRDITPQIYAIPEPGHIWKGKFEISRGSKLPIHCDGIQAHVSSLASHKVLEVAKNLPPKLLLAEVTRSSVWPTQFIRSQAREDNIALYFFAKDLASYNRSYKTLVDSMIKNDFCLKGNFGGLELLVFSSNLLPEKTQRWNKLLFLWSVFRGKKISCSDKLPTQKACISNLKEEPLNHDTVTSSISAFRNLFSSGQPSESFSDIVKQTLNPTTLMNMQADTSGRMVEVCQTEVPPEQKLMGLQTTNDQQVDPVDTQKKIELSGDVLCSDSAQQAESNSKKRCEIDLNLSLEENEDSLKVEDEHLCKRLKPSIGGMGESTNFGDVNNSSYRFSSLTDGQGPHISGELHKSDGANNMPVSSASLNLEGDQNRFRSMLQQQVLSRQNEHQLQAVIPHLELSLAPPKQESIPSNELKVSLTLSIALPSAPNPPWN